MKHIRPQTVFCVCPGCGGTRWENSLFCSFHWNRCSREERNTITRMLCTIGAWGLTGHQDQFEDAREDLERYLEELAPTLHTRPTAPPASAQ